MAANGISKPYADDETVGKAMTLLGLGYSSDRVSHETGIPARTVRDWARSPQLAAKYGDAIKAARERIAYRWGQVVEDVLDRIEDGTETVSAVQAMTGWGIATDKVQRESPSGKSRTFVIVRSSDGSTIEVGAATDNA